MIPAMVVGPLVQLLALGYAANLDVAHVPIVLVDQDRSPASRALVERFTGAGTFDLVGAEDGVGGHRPLAGRRAGPARPGDRGRLRRGGRGRPARRRAGDRRRHGRQLLGAGPRLRLADPRRGRGGDARLAPRRRSRRGGGRALRAGPPGLVQPGPQEPLVLRPRGARHGADAGDHDPAVHGRGAGEGDRHAGAAQRHAATLRGSSSWAS